jgi:hypothetical protein
VGIGEQVARRVDIFLPGVIPSKWLSANHGERREGRVPMVIAGAKMELRGEVAIGLLAEIRVLGITESLDPCRVTLTQRWYKRASDGFYRAMDCGNAIYSLKAAIDGIKDAGLIVDDDYAHVRELTGRIERCETAALEGLRIEVEEIG